MTARKGSKKIVVMPQRAIDDHRIKPAAFYVLAVLASYANKDGLCFPSLATLAGRAGVSRQAIAKQLRNLENLGYVDTTRQATRSGANSSSLYRINYDENSEPTCSKSTGSEGGELCEPSVDSCQPEVHTLSTSEVHTLSTPEVDALSTPEVDAMINSSLNFPVNSQTDHRSEVDRQFDEFWKVYPSRGPHSNPKKPARQKFEAAIKRGVSGGEILLGAKNYAATVKTTASDPKYIAQAKTWLSQECWADHQVELKPKPKAYATC